MRLRSLFNSYTHHLVVVQVDHDERRWQMAELAVLSGLWLRLLMALFAASGFVFVAVQALGEGVQSAAGALLYGHLLALVLGLLVIQGAMTGVRIEVYNATGR